MFGAVETLQISSAQVKSMLATSTSRCASTVLALALLSAICSPLLLGNDFRFAHEGVLGTTLELHVIADDSSVATEVETSVLDEITRFDSILSSYDKHSELARLLRKPIGTETPVSHELFDAIQTFEEWAYASRGSLNAAVELLTKAWSHGEKLDNAPAATELREIVERINQPLFELSKSRTSVRRLSNVPVTLNAVAKGLILDRVAESVLKRAPNLRGMVINLGGDIRLVGDCEAQIVVSDPRADANGLDTGNAAGKSAIASFNLSSGAVATSGDSERYFKIAGKRYSHIIDPRTGQPVAHTKSATVIADQASTADAIATICSVLSANESLALVNALPGVDCLLVAASGSISTSVNWPQDTKSTDKKAEKKATGHEMLVAFEIGKPAQSRRYRRPYVAVWIEDEDKFPVKTLSLFLMQNNPGPRWYRDVRRWYADDQIRKLVDETDMIKTVSKPTRNPGKYKVTWDGRDDAGELLEAGKYTLLIEAAREHGTYQLIKQEFQFGESLSKKLKGNVEISSASMQYKVDAKAAK